MAIAKKIASSTIWYIVSVSADSVALMPRTAAVTLPNSTALASANNAPLRKLSAPGEATNSTPPKPTISAKARARPTFSFSQSAANKVANSGEEKLMATAPASGIRPSAMTIRLCATACVALRPTWSRRRSVRNTAKPLRGRISKAQTGSDPSARKNSTSAKE